ncbi:tripartite tricarboxylate transporter permease [Psychromarinibacter halotolerans]|uniref:Tripartite tricarboxylate transporter permease n=1 Tax=Psychromarinibacter halotolerans TaxID=1775175 RepID=A0ABV7GZ07_9RHOB|nr:tripartite tricarboxylate transporter permease [Psychromarinibacter halotolerans]MDF0598533.1 tripartite tricarboxylate transporter permease [Psychromarinibacter halotolerans]
MIIDHLGNAIGLVMTWNMALVMLSCALFGLFVGAVPGLSATMATAMLVPLTFFMDPVPAISAIVTTAAMAIFASDIPAALVRIPGTAASAAYVGDLTALTAKGRVGRALGISVTASAIGGVFGSLVLMFAAPQLALVSLNFTSFEYFWLALLGLSAAVMLGNASILKSLMALAIGLMIASVGMDTTSGTPRFTFGAASLLDGVAFVPALIGMFAVPELIRTFVHRDETPPVAPIGNPFRMFQGLGRVLWTSKLNLLRSSTIGTAIGILPGAGSDIGSWISYAVSKRFSRKPEAYGKGSEEAVLGACAANNSALSGAYVPAMVFGIPGDSITAIVIGVLYVKGLNPGPMVFMTNADTVAAIFLVFLLANLLIVPLGLLAIALASQVLRVPKLALAPLILGFCIVGSYSIDASASGIIIMIVLGVLAYLMEENGFPVAPTILGIVMGLLVERNLVSNMIKSDGAFLPFVERPIAAGLALTCLLVWTVPAIGWLRKRRRGTATAPTATEQET